MADGPGQVRVRTAGQIVQSLLNSAGGSGAAALLKFRYGGMNRSLKCSRTSCDQLAVLKLPPKTLLDEEGYP